MFWAKEVKKCIDQSPKKSIRVQRRQTWAAHVQEDNNRKGLVLSETFVVIECHVLLCDSVILVQAEFDKCIGHRRSRKPRPR